MLKGNIFKKTFEYLFLKPCFIKKIEDEYDRFFTSGKDENYIEIGGFAVNNGAKFIVIMMSFVTIMSDVLFWLKHNTFNLNTMLIMNIITILLIPFLSIVFARSIENFLIKSKFSEKNIHKIRKKLLVNYNKKDVDIMTGESLSLEKMQSIFDSIKGVLTNEEILEVFNRVQYKNNENYNITNLYTILSMLEEAKKKKEIHMPKKL